MAGTWLAIEVELLGGRGEDLWPPPGRRLAVAPSHTFAQLAEAIDRAFARWDLAHLQCFTLDDGVVIGSLQFVEELIDSPVGALGAAGLGLDEATIGGHVAVGDAFRYVFDLGDEWMHRCTVTGLIDPADALGSVPQLPASYAGWGSLPDQHGRRWADDPGGGPLPPQPARPDPMLTGGWPETAEPADPVDLRELRGAVARGDIAAIRAAVEGHDVDDALQQVGSAWQLVLTAGDDRDASLAVSLVNRLTLRGAPGDDVLAEDLTAQLRGTPLAARQLSVDLVELAAELDGPQDQPSGALDLATGEVLPHFLTDPMEVGDDAYVDVNDEPGRWLGLWRSGSRDGWRDMAAFTAGVRAADVRQRLERAIEGRGAFRRFRDAVHDEGLADAWFRYADDRAMGRARQFLADQGIRVAPG